MAPIVTAGGYSWEKTTAFFSARHPCPGSHVNLLCILQRKRKKKLELCVSSLHRGHANILQTNDFISRIVRVILDDDEETFRTSPAAQSQSQTKETLIGLQKTPG